MEYRLGEARGSDLPGRCVKDPLAVFLYVLMLCVLAFVAWVNWPEIKAITHEQKVEILLALIAIRVWFDKDKKD